MFTQACFIRKNTYDLRHSLNNMGKTNCTQRVFPILISNYEIYYGVHDFEESIDNLMLNGFIDCGTNEELFLAIAALRDDSDIHQWFIMDAEIYTEISKGDWFVATDIKGGKHVGTQIDPLYCHKAAVEELIKHFTA